MSVVIEELTRVVGGLPPELARKVLDFAHALERSKSAPVDESTEWSDDDMREASLAAMRRFDSEHPDEDWGDVLDKRGDNDAPAR
jgi:hypothetical protein